MVAEPTSPNGTNGHTASHSTTPLTGLPRLDTVPPAPTAIPTPTNGTALGTHTLTNVPVPLSPPFAAPFLMEHGMQLLPQEKVKELLARRSKLLKDLSRAMSEASQAFITSKRDGRQIPMLLVLDMDTLRSGFDRLADLRDEVLGLLESGS